MSKIEWTGATWNPVVGCSPVSPGCLNCYAARQAMRLERIGVRGYAPLSVEGERLDVNGVPEVEEVRIAERRNGRAVFTGSVRTVPEALSVPLSRKTPETYFVCSMADLFHESVPFEFIDRVWAVMALCPHHTFQVLTKRPERMRAYLASIENDEEVAGAPGMMRLGCAAGCLLDGPWIWGQPASTRTRIEHFISDTHECDDEDSEYEAQPVPWPLPNVWLGTSVEDTATGYARIPRLVECPAAVRFLSCEPLLRAVDLQPWFTRPDWGPVQADGNRPYMPRVCRDKIHWVIVGGESGPGSRPMDPDWARSLRDQCQAAGVAYFFKQWGEWWPVDQWEWTPERVLPDESEWASHPRMTRTEDGALMFRVGKGDAGRLLDGRTWDEMPGGAGKAVTA